jgi:hypothetical protein
MQWRHCCKWQRIQLRTMCDFGTKCEDSRRNDGLGHDSQFNVAQEKKVAFTKGNLIFFKFCLNISLHYTWAFEQTYNFQIKMFMAPNLEKT